MLYTALPAGGKALNVYFIHYKNSTRLIVLQFSGSDYSLFEGTRPCILGKFNKKTQCLERQWINDWKTFESTFYLGMSPPNNFKSAACSTKRPFTGFVSRKTWPGSFSLSLSFLSLLKKKNGVEAPWNVIIKTCRSLWRVKLQICMNSYPEDYRRLAVRFI